MNTAAPIAGAPNTQQAAALRFIIEYIRGNGAAPTWQEIATRLGLRTKNPDIVVRLIRKGYLSRLPVPSRNVAVTKLGHEWYRDTVPITEQGVLPPSISSTYDPG